MGDVSDPDPGEMIKVFVVKELYIPDPDHCGECEFKDESEDDFLWCNLFNKILEENDTGCLRHQCCKDNETRDQ